MRSFSTKFMNQKSMIEVRTSICNSERENYLSISTYLSVHELGRVPTQKL